MEIKIGKNALYNDFLPDQKLYMKLNGLTIGNLVRLRAAEGHRYLIQMDGGINEENVGRVALAGCDVVVTGSAVFQSPDPGAFLESMRVKVKEALDDADIGS